jgi:hypothetical protein
VENPCGKLKKFSRIYTTKPKNRIQKFKDPISHQKTATTIHRDKMLKHNSPSKFSTTNTVNKEKNLKSGWLTARPTINHLGELKNATKNPPYRRINQTLTIK